MQTSPGPVGARVIAVTGLSSGAGKSTLASGLARALNAAVVQLDRCETFTRLPPGVVHDWISRGAPPDEFPADGYARAIMEARQSGVGHVIVDGHLGRTHGPTAAMIDFMIYIDVPLDIALARRILRKARAAEDPRNPPVAVLRSIEGDLATYLEWVRGAYALQHGRLAPIADLALDGRSPPDELLRQSIEAINRKFR